MAGYRETEQLKRQMADLLPYYDNSKTAVIEQAVAALHQQHFPAQYPDPPHIVGWDALILAQDAPCSDTGVMLRAGKKAYREVWSDGRPGDIVSRESLIADRVITD